VTDPLRPSETRWRPVFAGFLFSALLLGLWWAPAGRCADLPPLPGPANPPAEKGANTNPYAESGRWTIAPTISYYIPEGAGNAALFNDALGVGAQLSYRPGTAPGPLRVIGSFSYLQMTPGPSLTTELSSSNFFSSTPTPSPSGPIPGSPSVTGFILTVGAAWDFGSVFPPSWTAWGTLSPYVRGDIGAASLSASGSGNLDGHPYGMVVDVGGGMSWHVPGLPMGVFIELDPTGLAISDEFLFLTPLVSGITIWF
jgi:hypothetical protein